ncbi:MAG: hypothetical protein Q4F40_06775 [Akkermansia sp.]|nr:hypothetical protein [Akkermansia sp.]
MNTLRFLTAFIGLALSCRAGEDIAVAEQLLRDGKPTEALAELQLAPHSPAAMYWKGRALVELNRLPQAVSMFREVASDSVFFPYAAKGILYCAWLSPQLDFVEYVAPLTACDNKEIATLAQAALAEHQLRYTTHGDVSTLEPLRALAAEDAGLQPVVDLLNIEEFRRQKQFDQAINACREMESNPNIPLIMKQRARLALAEVYYDKAELAKAMAAASPNGELDDEEMEDDEGKGEETLLLFISSNPESPLLDEAFRRLNSHGAFSGSEYAYSKLVDWSSELSKPHRAALAMAVLQQLQLQRTGYNEQDSTLANTAANQLPNEPVSQLIIGEQVRRLIQKGDIAQATLYLNMMKQDDTDPRHLFYKACCSPHNSSRTAEMFLKSAEIASSDLQATALCNAMYCAVLSNNQPMVDSLLTKELPVKARRALLLTHAGLILKSNPAQARAEIESAALLEPTTAELIEITLQLAELDVQSAPADALVRLQACTNEERKSWSTEQALRYHALLIHAAEKLKIGGEDAPSAIELLTEAVKTTETGEVRDVLTINLAYRLSESDRHVEAMQMLQKLAEAATNGELKARALLLCGRQAEQLSSLENLTRAAEFFKAAAEIKSPYRNKALMLQARVLAWINRGEEAQVILAEVLRDNTLTITERALALSIQAHEQTLRGTTEGIAAALETNQRIFELSPLPEAWQTRARLQHASLLARSGKREEAIADYMSLVEGVAQSPTADAPTEEQWFVIYFASSGAIAQLMRGEQFQEAAELADRIAAWPEPTGTEFRVIGKGKRAEQFANWADNIRKFNYLTPGTKRN